MLKVAIAYLMTAAVLGYTVQRGGRPERWTAVLFAVGLAATSGTYLLGPVNFRTVNVPVLFIDAAMLLALGAIALRANRFWPLWVTAFQIVTLGVHAVRAYDRDILSIVYQRLTGEISYFMMLLLVLGTVRYRDRAATSGTAEPDWSPFKW